MAALLARVIPGSVRPWLPTLLVLLGGWLLGWAVALALESTAQLLGHRHDAAEEQAETERQQQIEQALARRREREEQP